MEKICKVCASGLDEVTFHLEEVYGNAQWALRYGATKESLLGEIEYALETHENCLHEDGWLIVPDAQATDDQSAASETSSSIEKTNIEPSD